MAAGLRATAKAAEHPPEPKVGAAVLAPTACCKLSKRESQRMLGSSRPEAVLQLKTLPTKKGRTNPSLTVPQTLLNETI